MYLYPCLALATNHETMVAKGYDGAAGGAPEYKKRTKDVAPQAKYVHCYAHCLNLILADTVVRHISDASEFFFLHFLKHCKCLCLQVKCIQYLWKSNQSGTKEFNQGSFNIFQKHGGYVSLAQWM